MADQWLVRQSQAMAPSALLVRGPFAKEEVLAMIREGKLEVDDEVCPENGYWFYLHETEEVKNLLGIEAAEAIQHGGAGPDDEATQPEIQITSSEEKTQPDLKPAAPESSYALTPPPVIRIERRALARAFSEKFWSVLFMVFVGLAVVGVVWVIRSFRT